MSRVFEEEELNQEREPRGVSEALKDRVICRELIIKK